MRGSARALVAAGALLLLLPGPLAAQQPSASDEDASYPFLTRQGQLLFDYGRFDEATATFEQACATPEGAADFECWRRLATTAEKAGRVGVAISAWDSATSVSGGDPAAAGRELDRLLGAYGAVRLVVPPGRDLPTVPGLLEFMGMLIDPAAKAYIAAVVERVGAEGLDRDEIWLPSGEYRFEGLSFVIEASAASELVLPPTLVPYRSRAFRAAGGPAPAGLAGPWSLGVDVEVAAGGTPGGGLGLGPVGVGGRVRFGRRLGALRLEVGARIGVTRTASPGGEVERSGSALGLLGELDVGVDLAPASRLLITPHAAIVGGSTGAMLGGCRAEKGGSAHVWDGECRLGSLAAGARAGLDFELIPPARVGRIGIRIGLFGEALAAGLVAVPGDPLTGAEDATLLRLSRWRFTLLRGGLDVGLSIRL